MPFEARSDAPEMLDLVEEAFDPVALLLERLGGATPFVAVGDVGEVRRRAPGLNALAQPIGIIGLAAKKDITFAQIDEQGLRAQKIVGLARGAEELDRQATGIGEHVDFDDQSFSAECQ